MTAEKRVELRGVLEDTVSSASIGGDGSLVVRLFDFSTEAHSFLGRDVAFLLHVAAADKEETCKRLLHEAQPAGLDRDDALLRAMQERFADYYEVKQWLEEQRIPFRKEFDWWA